MTSDEGWTVIELLDGAAIGAVQADIDRLLAEPPERRHAGTGVRSPAAGSDTTPVPVHPLPA